MSPSRDYLFPWTNEWFREDCEPTPGTPGATWDDSAAAVNLFVTHNRMHDFSYFLGFTERNWNAQDSNFGLTETFRENDPLIGNVQAGVLAGARDNANMFTLPEGVSVGHEHVHVAAGRGGLLLPPAWTATTTWA